MANRFWVGGSGTWNTTNTNNWAPGITQITASCSGTTLTVTSATKPSIGQTIWTNSTNTSLGVITSGSGSTWTVSIGGTYSSQGMYGAVPGASVPTTADSVNWIAGTQAFTVTLTGALACLDLNYTTGVTFAQGTSPTLTVAGNFTLAGNTVWSATGTITFNPTSSPVTITTAGVTINGSITIDGAGDTVALGGALTLGSIRSLSLSNGTLDLAGFTLTVGASFITGGGTKNLTFNGGTVVCPSAGGTAFYNLNPTGFTTTAGTGTGTISMTAATAKTFVGGGSTFNCTLNQGGAGALTITGANTFDDITDTVQPATVIFPASTTTTFLSGFSLSGTSGNLITIQSSSAGTRATLSKSSGTVSVSFCSIKDSAATGGATWNAFTTNGNVDAGNNTGWIFNPNTNFLAFFN